MRTLHPELDEASIAENHEVTERLQALLGDGGAPDAAELVELRRQRREGAAPFPAPWRHADAVDLEVAGPGGPVPIRILEPPDAHGTYVHVTGGGWCTGAADINDVVLWDIAEVSGATVVCVGHRLAPEHPHPAAVDDVVAALRWYDAAGTAPLALGGDSTGAHLALLAALQLRDEGGGPPIIALNLAIGIYDLTERAAWRSTSGDDPLVSAALLDRYVSWYVPDRADRRAASPLHRRLHSLPPTLVTTAGLDPLRRDSRALADALDEAGNDVTFVEYPGASHGFATFATTMAEHARGTQASFLTEHLVAAVPTTEIGAPR